MRDILKNYKGVIKILNKKKNITLPHEYKFRFSDKGCHTFSNVSIKKKGIFRVKISDEKNKLFGTSNPVAPAFLENSYHIYFGDIHVHGRVIR